MATLITELDSLVRLKYFSGVALVSVLYDHLLTLDDEFSTVWTNPHRHYLQKLIFVLNRYFAEAVVLYVAYGGEMFKRLTGFKDVDYPRCRRFLWVFALGATAFIATTQSFITATTALVIITVIKVQSAIFFIPELGTCAILNIPSTFPYVAGALLGFDVFLILLAVFNAFERPHRTGADILDSLHSDLYSSQWSEVVSILRIATLIMTIVGTPADCFGVLSMVWALNSVIASRIHLRVEGLKFAIFGKPGTSFLLL
ncbi:hypothetical protein BT96DRAFT_932693 [Gymnopus androsaceus JB14]|uniref:DUF6533 domain-containing protein n=1 Tax=Gymnopus androsaceus JB14 TaxID=1447944 RepID=A0A6A4ID48_9AGAR|nr:hypothetical protein BT96DRAFT_932693 [Gymnopus androsaceus JB14]